MPYTGFTSLAAKLVCLGPVKREMSTYYVTLYFPQQLSQLVTTWFVARQVWFLGRKTRNIAIHLVLQQFCITSCTFSLKVNSDLRPRPHLGCDNIIDPGEVLCPAVLVKNKGLLVLLSFAGSQKSPSGRSYHCFVFAPRLSRYFWKRRKDLRFQKYSDTSGQGLS